MRKWAQRLGCLASVAVALGACTTERSGGREQEMELDVATLLGSTTRMTYGDHGDAFGDLSVPATRPSGGASWPVVVLIHGGFWRDGFFLDLMEPLVPSLTERGIAVWNIEYRRVGAGGGHPETFEDIAAAVDHVAVLDEQLDGVLDLARVAAVGHSAGGHLAVWAAGRARLRSGDVGASPAVSPSLAISQAGVLDLVDCADQRLGAGACPDLLGGSPAEVPDRYDLASPIGQVPIDPSVVLIHGALDSIVPLRQSERYLDAGARAGGDVQLVVDGGAAHFEHLDPDHQVWAAALDALRAAGFSD